MVDRIGALVRLRTAIKALSTSDSYCKRLDKATAALVWLRPEDFPEQIRNRATRVLSVRSFVAEKYGKHYFYNFNTKLSYKHRKALVEDIICLYEACLIDCGKNGEEYIYPEDVKSMATKP